MGESDNGDAPKSSDEAVRQQKEALVNARATVQRPSMPKSPQSPQVWNSNSSEILTYPEFAPSQRVPVSPLVTLRRLLLVLYLTTGTAFTLFLVSKVYLLYGIGSHYSCFSNLFADKL
jgi:hypothetical protein